MFKQPVVVVAMDMADVAPLMARADVEVVAVPSTVVVDKYRFPPAFRNVHWARPAPAERESCGAVAENGLNNH